jgi:hypothetical protein
MRLDRVGVDDIVEARIKGRSVRGRVTEITDGIVYFRPISPRPGINRDLDGHTWPG